MRSNEIIIKNMEECHIDQIVEIEKRCFAIPWTKNSFLQELFFNDKALYVVALYEEEVIGYGGMWKIIDEGHITNIAVDSKYQGKRIGSRILEEMIYIARKNNIVSMTLEVRKSNKIAQKLYEKYGFYSLGTRKNYYEDNKEDAVIMWNDNLI